MDIRPELTKQLNKQTNKQTIRQTSKIGKEVTLQKRGLYRRPYIRLYDSQL